MSVSSYLSRCMYNAAQTANTWYKKQGGVSMAGIIDRAVLMAASALAFYLYFLNAWQSVPLACALAFIGCAILETLLRKRPQRRRISGSMARHALYQIAQMPDAEGLAAIEALIRWRWPERNASLCALLKYPESSLSPAEIFSLWKDHRSEERLLIACTCPCDRRGLAFARTLDHPKVAVVDARGLTALLRRRDCPIQLAQAERPPFMARLKARTARARAAKPTLREGIWALGSLMMYLIWGNPLQLVIALVTLFHLGVCLYRQAVPEQPF